jgi:hypothetical protein
MSSRFPWLLALALLAAGLSSCVSTLPSAEQLDAYEKTARTEYREQYAALEAQRATMSPEQYAAAKTELDQYVRNKADDKAWGRHMLTESEMKAAGIPTPDQPMDLRAPGAGSIPNSMYNTPRNNPLTGQQGAYLSTGATY